MLAGLGRAVRSGWPPGKRQPPVLLDGQAARGGRGGCPPPSAPQLQMKTIKMREARGRDAREKAQLLRKQMHQETPVPKRKKKSRLSITLHDSLNLKWDVNDGGFPLFFCWQTSFSCVLQPAQCFQSEKLQSLQKRKARVRCNFVKPVRLWRHAGAWRGRGGAPYSTLVPSDEVTITYRHGLPLITLTLPTRSERCQFTVKPTVTTIGAFLQDVQREDKGIERAEAFTTDGSKVSCATLMEVLLMNDFKLVINNTAYSVSPPVKDKLSSERATEMEDIKSLVHRLFVALHLEDHQIRKERELLQKLDHLKEELLPLEQMKARIMDSADAKTSKLLWVGLALMSTQGGALAWLTWWVYSWDIMEPVTYFITYGSAMAFYAYFVLTKQDYIYPDAKDRQFLHYFYRKSKKQHFNVERYNKLKEDLAEAEESLRRLRQPLHLRLPIQEISDKD